MTEPVLRVYLAGTMCLEHGQTLVREDRFPGRQGRLAFAMLAAERDRAVAREELAHELWAGEPPPAWETGLRVIVSKLRSVLAETGLEADPITSAFGCYQLRLPSGTWIDLEAADDAVHRAETAFRAAAGDEAIGWALVANAIARRPFLPGDEGAFVDRWRERLREIRLRSLEVRAAVLLDRGEHTLAARDAEALIELAPFRETAHRLLMRSRAAAGNPAEAILAYNRCREMLSVELGVDPSPETQDVYLEILRSTG